MSSSVQQVAVDGQQCTGDKLHMRNVQEATADEQQGEESRAADLWSNGEHRWIEAAPVITGSPVLRYCGLAK